MMKYLWILVILSATSAFGQNAYGPDYLNLHCTTPDPNNSSPAFGNTARPGFAPSTSANGSAVIYCDSTTGGLKASFNGGAYSAVSGAASVFASNGSVTATCSPISTGLTVAGSTTTGVTSFGGNGLDFCSNGTRVVLMVASGMVMEGTANFGFNGGKGQHITPFAANNDLGGVCSGTTTTCSVTFTTNYTSTPTCVVTPTTAGVTSFIITSQANTGFTVTYAPSATTNFNYICIGNPN